MANEVIKSIGTGIAGSLIATSLFRLLVEKGVITADEATTIITRSIDALHLARTDEERAALQILAHVHRKLEP